MLNNIINWYLRNRVSRIEAFLKDPKKTQEDWFRYLMEQAALTKFGKAHDISKDIAYRDYVNQLPLFEYEQKQPYIERMLHGEPDVLWPGKIEWFSKSSGTTSSRSKLIPVSTENLETSHIRGPKDTLSFYAQLKPNNALFRGSAIVMGGTHEVYDVNAGTHCGDVSAIMMEHMPVLGKWMVIPDVETALMAEWEEKIAKIAKAAAQSNITNLSGVPTWTIVLFRKILEITGKSNLLEVWPDFELFIHGGVSFAPYIEQFKQFFPGDQVSYLEVYNASEGYFAAQREFGDDGMLLLLDNGVFYEFVPMNQYGSSNPGIIPLSEVQTDISYAMVITTNAGLYRYVIGDTVRFTSLTPYKIRITGRTKQFLNVFGEEVIVENADKALFQACEKHRAVVSEYTVGPKFLQKEEKGAHEWVVEFEKSPIDFNAFAHDLDLNLQLLNSDYEAKRYRNMALEELQLHPVPTNTFLKWMKNRNKLGGQNKVPRLSNSREYLESILEMVNGN